MKTIKEELQGKSKSFLIIYIENLVKNLEGATQEANRLRQVALWQKQMRLNNNWISVTDTLPKLNKYLFSAHVLVLTNTGLISIGYLDDSHNKKEWLRNDSPKSFAKTGYSITHWQPLPKYPNRKQKKKAEVFKEAATISQMVNNIFYER